MLPLHLTLIAWALQVQTGGDCPSTAAITARLAALASDATSPGPAASQRVLVTSVAAGTTVQLVGADGEPLAAKLLPPGETCEELAETVAVVLAAWQTELAGGALAMPRPPARASAKVAQPGPAREPGGLTVSYLAGLFAAADAEGMSSSFWLGVRVARPTSRLGAALSLVGSGPREAALVPGVARWGRVAVAAGPSLRFTTGHWLVLGEADAVGALLIARGSGFQTNLGIESWQPGAALALRVGRSFGRLAPHVGIVAEAWPLEEEIAVRGASTSKRLPRWDVLLGAGLIFE
jgi:hypothetical protein